MVFVRPSSPKPSAFSLPHLLQGAHSEQVLSTGGHPTHAKSTTPPPQAPAIRPQASSPRPPVSGLPNLDVSTFRRFHQKTTQTSPRPNPCPPQELQAKKIPCVTICHLRFRQTCARSALVFTLGTSAPQSLGPCLSPMQRSEVGGRWPTCRAAQCRCPCITRASPSPPPLRPQASGLRPQVFSSKNHPNLAPPHPNPCPSKHLPALPKTFFAYCHLRIAAVHPWNLKPEERMITANWIDLDVLNSWRFDVSCPLRITHNSSGPPAKNPKTGSIHRKSGYSRKKPIPMYVWTH